MSSSLSPGRRQSAPPPRRGVGQPRRLQSALGLAAATLLAGCASLPPDAGLAGVAALSQARIGLAPSLQADTTPDAATQARVAELLQQPLRADDAVALALLGNRGLQARLAAVGVAQADLVRASRPANPRFSLGRLRSAGAVEIDRAVVFDVLGLLSLPWARRAATASVRPACAGV